MATLLHVIHQEVLIGPSGLRGVLAVPPDATGLVIFAHGSGSGRLSPRNNHVAEALRRSGCATLLLDLLTPSEEADRANVFDIALLAERLTCAATWASHQLALEDLSIGYFGASTGAGAALVAATFEGPEIAAIVSRGGRPDLAGDSLPLVRAPTLLLVGSLDGPVIGLNRQAFAALTAPKELVIIEGASHLFEEPGTLEQVIAQASQWFARWLAKA
jgi:dienelactone hydrolase